ncbi:ABC transporter ATP-binding protein [Georhizobium profundi]|jgi:biotin transport system ATP-binding protein|uniref:ABC transporter ATP-binding protein n=1 Tax=Georhizobium profundi TaxID=2341112 RepID=A0A3S9BAL2_9HYPH|nr:ABC transporter ATP-binding protein [Georhizobium profundi]AZN73969.1 ABC transporter ATP-binding protein [Georhizobium profundi]
MISFSKVVVEKGDRVILRDINVELHEKRVGIIGRNGSGKSTFARLFNGLEKPTSGTISFDGSTEPKDLRGKVGFVFQNPDNQIVYPIVGEDLAFGLKNMKLSKTAIEERIAEVTARFQIEHLQDRLTHQLSGGERQMVALVGVLVMQPQMIIFDEPTTLLDLWNKRRLMRAITDLQEHVVLISHDLDLLRQFDRVIHIEAGRIVGDGEPNAVIDDYIARSE